MMLTLKYSTPCLPNGNAQNTSFTPDKVSYNENDTVTVTCDPGYKPGSTNLTCSKNGTWDPRWPYCLKIRCPKLSIPNGQVIPDSVTKTLSDIGTTAFFSCFLGYTMIGSSVLTCQDDGTWSGTAPVCNVNMCPELPRPTGGFGYYSANPPARHPGNVFSQSCVCSCVQEGSAERLCQNNGTWTGSPLSCHRKCTKFGPERVKGVVTYSADPPFENSTAVFSCRTGARLVGDRTARCLADGTWNITEIPLCAPYCSLELSPLWNVTLSPSTYKKDSLTVGYTLTFSCPSPYLSYLSGSPFMTCLNTGQWNSTVPSCIPVVENIDKKMQSLMKSGLSVLAGVLISFFIIVAILVYINRKLLSPSRSNQIPNQQRIRSIRSMNSNQISMSQMPIPRIRPKPMYNDTWNRSNVFVVGIDNQAFEDDLY